MSHDDAGRLDSMGQHLGHFACLGSAKYLDKQFGVVGTRLQPERPQSLDAFAILGGPNGQTAKRHFRVCPVNGGFSRCISTGMKRWG